MSQVMRLSAKESKFQYSSTSNISVALKHIYLDPFMARK